MSTVIAAFVVLLLAVAAMAVGVIFGRAPIRGSCGGVGGACAACTGTCERRAAAADADTRENDPC